MRVSESRLATLLLLCVFFWMVASASFSGFIGKWGLMGDAGDPKAQERFGFEIMLDATAHKPFVYRQFVPLIAKAADKVTPDAIQYYSRWYLLPKRHFSELMPAPDREQRFLYVVIYYISYLSLFASLFVMRRILLDLGIDRIVSIVTPSAMVLALPYIQTVGGFFYDGVELLFMSAAFLAALRGKIVLLVALVLPATLNKETFIFFLPSLFPLLLQRLSIKPAVMVTGIAVLVSGLINVVVKVAFMGSPKGGVAELHWLANIKYYLNPLSYLRFVELTYGIIGPERVFVGTLMVAGILVLRGWRDAPVKIRRHLAIVSAINIPLVLLFCASGEMRNLSMLYVGLMVMAAFAINRGGGPAPVRNEARS